MRRPLAALVTIVALGAAACGVRLQDDPQRIDRREVPFGLLDRPDPGERVSFVVYVLSRDRLIAVTRQRIGPLTPELAVTALLQGPTFNEIAAGLRSAIPSGTTLVGVSREGDAMTIDLSAAFAGARDVSAAYQQLAATVGELPGISALRLTVEGRELPVP